MAVRQFYGRRRRGLELGLYRWTTSEALLDTRRMNRVPNAQIRELKGLMRVFYGGLAMWRGWRGTGLRGESMEESVLVVV